MYDSRPHRRSTQQPAPHTRIVERLPPAKSGSLPPPRPPRCTIPGPPPRCAIPGPPPGVRFQLRPPLPISPAAEPIQAGVPQASPPPAGTGMLEGDRSLAGSGNVRPEARRGPVRDSSPIPPWPTTGGAGPDLGPTGSGVFQAPPTLGDRVWSPRGADEAGPGSTSPFARLVRRWWGCRLWRGPGGSRGREQASRRPQDPARCLPKPGSSAPGRRHQRDPGGPVSGPTLSPCLPRQPPPVPPGRTFRHRPGLPLPTVPHPPHPPPYRIHLNALTRPTPPRSPPGTAPAIDPSWTFRSGSGGCAGVLRPGRPLRTTP